MKSVENILDDFICQHHNFNTSPISNSNETTQYSYFSTILKYTIWVTPNTIRIKNVYFNVYCILSYSFLHNIKRKVTNC